MACATRTIAVIGNVGVGKTTLCERMCKRGLRPRKVPGCRAELSEALIGADSKGWRLSLFNGLFRATKEETLVAPSPASESETGCPPPTSVATLVDTPGGALLFARSEEECATRNLFMAGEADVLVVVADAKNLRRSLVLFLQACEFRLPTVLILNMKDEAQQLGLEFDLEQLAAMTTVKVTPLVAVEGRVLERMTALFERAEIPSIRVCYPAEVEKALETVAELLGDAPIPPRALGLLLLADDSRAEQMLQEEIDRGAADQVRDVIRKARQTFHHPVEVMIANALYDEAERIAQRVTHRTPPGAAVLQRFGHYAADPLFGWPIALLVILAGYYWVGVLGATTVVDYLNANLFNALLLPACERLFGGLPWAFARDAVLDPNFGLVPTALFLAVGLVLPVLFFFYTFFGFLEDSGYLPRLSALMDRFMRRLGLTGKGILPLAFGFSCITMAILTARTLPTRKQRLLASFLLLMGFPCAPLLAVILIVLEPLPWTATATLFGLLFLQVLTAGVLANFILPGRSSDFMLELPPIRIPRLRVILSRAGRLSCVFLREALPAFVAASLLLFTLDRLGGLDVLERLSRPIVQGMLGLPDQAVQVFLKTMIRRENGAAELTVVNDHFNGLQLVVTLYVMTFVVPCVNAVIVLFKEQGAKICAVLLLIVSSYALLAGTALNWGCQALGVTFR